VDRLPVVVNIQRSAPEPDVAKGEGFRTPARCAAAVWAWALRSGIRRRAILSARATAPGFTSIPYSLCERYYRAARQAGRSIRIRVLKQVSPYPKSLQAAAGSDKLPYLHNLGRVFRKFISCY
jgi:hypothetical protein